MSKERLHTVIFLHIPKTAGVTFGSILTRIYRPEEIATYRMKFPLDSYYASVYAKRKQLHLLRGHFTFGAHRFVVAPFVYLTFLRDPIDRVISLYYFYREWKDGPLYKDVQKISLEEFVTSGITRLADNGMVRQLSGVGSHVRYGSCTQETLQQAKENLERYFLVGLVQEFDRSIEIFSSLLGWQIPEYQPRNVTKNRPKRDEISAQTLAVLEKYNQLDKELYRFGVELYRKQCADPQAFFQSKQQYDARGSFWGAIDARWRLLWLKELIEMK